MTTYIVGYAHATGCTTEYPYKVLTGHRSIRAAQASARRLNAADAPVEIIGTNLPLRSVGAYLARADIAALWQA